MNHILTNEDLVNAKNLHAAIFIGMMEDLGLDTGSMKYKNTLKNWIPKLRGALKYLHGLEYLEFTSFRPMTVEIAIKRWAVGDMESYNLANTYRFRDRQLRYNLALKRFLDDIYGKGDAVLSALIVTENPGLVSEMARRGGLRQAEAENAEHRILGQANKIIEQLDRMLESDYTQPLNSHLSVKGIEMRILKEDVT